MLFIVFDPMTEKYSQLVCVFHPTFPGFFEQRCQLNSILCRFDLNHILKDLGTVKINSCLAHRCFPPAVLQRARWLV